MEFSAASPVDLGQLAESWLRDAPSGPADPAAPPTFAKAMAAGVDSDASDTADTDGQVLPVSGELLPLTLIPPALTATPPLPAQPTPPAAIEVPAAPAAAVLAAVPAAEIGPGAVTDAPPAADDDGSPDARRPALPAAVSPKAAPVAALDDAVDRNAIAPQATVVETPPVDSEGDAVATAVARATPAASLDSPAPAPAAAGKRTVIEPVAAAAVDAAERGETGITPDPEDGAEPADLLESSPAGRPRTDETAPRSPDRAGTLPARAETPVAAPHAATDTGPGRLATTDAPAARPDAPVPQYDLDHGADVDGLATRIRWLADHGIGEARIRLNPPELGALDIHLRLVEDKTYVHIATHGQGTRDLLEGAVPRLRALLDAGGLTLGGASIDGGGRGPGNDGGWRPDEPAAFVPGASPSQSSSAGHRARPGPGGVDLFA